MPSIRIQPNPELERAVVIHRRRDIMLIQHLDPIKPHLIESRAIRLPTRLDNHLVPHARGNRGKVTKRLGLLRADAPLLDARVELVSDQPHHARGHVVVAARVGEIRDELRDVVRLRWGELPVLL